MTKSRVCAERTINLAKQTCVKKTNLLVYEKPKENETAAMPKTHIPSICIPQAKRIKICTGAQLKKICPPPPCPCPPKVPGPGLLRRLARLLGLGVKSALALAAVYVTYDMGIWGDSKATGELYKNICNKFLPKFMDPPVKAQQHLPQACQAELELFNIQEKDDFCCDKFPIDHESGIYELQQKWNKIVSVTFFSIATFPEHVRKWSHQFYRGVLSNEETTIKEENVEGKTDVEEEGECTCEDE